MPEFVRDSNEDEMVLEFIKAESISKDWLDYYNFPDGFSYEELIGNADLRDDYQNSVRRSMLNYRGYATRTALFAGFPLQVQWNFQRFSIAEIVDFKYANIAPWSYLAGHTRLVREGVDAIGEDPQRVVGLGIHLEKLEAIRERLKSGVVLARLIVAAVGPTYVIVEGQMRATALAALPADRTFEALVGLADDFKHWQCR
ncbi:MAG TPA: hypothetical protein VID19_06615 [Candidatus Eremiobacteraceae bacterium]|jgi:hypothetical protein